MLFRSISVTLRPVSFHYAYESKMQDAPIDNYVRPFVEALAKRLRLKLMIAGATISPSEAQDVGEDMTASWSVKLSDDGPQEGFIKSSLAPTSYDREGRDYDWARVEVPITLDAKSPQSIASWLSTVGTILGLGVTLGSLISGIRTWRERKEAKKRLEVDEEDRHRRILP